jgi:excisionase family DNA binding protein
MQEKNVTRVACSRLDGRTEAQNDPVLPAEMSEVLRRLDEIQASLAVLVAQRAVKAWYTTAEVAQILGKSDYTVREYCRKGQVRAEKSANGRGWLISHDELTRLRNHGPVPEQQTDRVVNR